MPKSLLKQNLSLVLFLFFTNSRGDSITYLARLAMLYSSYREWVLPDGSCALAAYSELPSK